MMDEKWIPRDFAELLEFRKKAVFLDFRGFRGKPTAVCILSVCDLECDSSSNLKKYPGRLFHQYTAIET